MPTPFFEFPRTAHDTVALTARIDSWFTRAGISDPERRATLTVGLADTLAAAAQVGNQLEIMLAADPRSTEGAEAAAEAIGIMEAWLFGEVKHHVAEIEVLWEAELWARVAERLPPDDTDETPVSAV